MGWSGSLNSESAVGERITYTSDTSGEGVYSVTSFTAPKKGVYRFQLCGSGGAMGSTEADSDGTFDTANLGGGTGGSTDGYLLLDKGERIYIGAGGPCSAAFVAKGYGASLAQAGTPLLIAGAGGGAGRCYKRADYRSWGYGGNGGGISGANGYSNNNQSQSAGGAGTQTGAGKGHDVNDGEDGGNGAYGAGGAGAYAETHGCPAWGGRGGDGYYGGGGGGCVASHNSSTDDTSSYGYGGGGGSGYVKNASLTVMGRTYVSTTTQGGGAEGGANGSVSVTYYARVQLPVFFDGAALERLFFNGTEVQGLVYNGTTIYARRGCGWLQRLRMRLRLRADLSARRTASLTASI